MNNFRSLLYSLADGWKGIFRNMMMSLMSMSMLTGSLVLVGSLTLVVVNIDALIESVGDRNEITIYLDEDVTNAEIDSISRELMEMRHISSFSFVSKSQALENMRKDLAEYASVLEGMEKDNPLRDGFVIQMDDPENVQLITDKLENIEKVDNIQARTDVIDSFIRVRNAIKWVSMGLMILLTGVSLFIVMNTVKMSAYTRREEIAIMRMVGASRGNIHFSFVTEGVIICVTGALIAYFVVSALYNRLLERAFSSTGFLNIIPFEQESGLLFFGFIGASVLLGTVASILSIGKYVKV